MKKNPLVIALFVFLLGTIAFSSCKKSENQPLLRKDMLIGTWEVTQTAKDENGNGKADQNELSPSPAGDFNQEVFNADGTGTVTIKTADIDTSMSFTWNLFNDDNNLMLTLDGESNSFIINSLSSSNMVLEDTTDPNKSAWTYFSKK